MLLAPSPALAQATPTPTAPAGSTPAADNPIVPGANITVTLLDLKTIAVADLLPALVIAPILCEIVVATR